VNQNRKTKGGQKNGYEKGGGEESKELERQGEGTLGLEGRGTEMDTASPKLPHGGIGANGRKKTKTGEKKTGGSK